MKSLLSMRGNGIKFWARERDPSVEQTLSFVHGIISSKPDQIVPALDAPVPWLPKRADTEFMMAERADFQRRIYEFRARQQKIRKEREDYYSAIWQKTCAALGNVSETSML